MKNSRNCKLLSYRVTDHGTNIVSWFSLKA